MAFIDLIAAGYLAKRAHNKFNPPQVEVPEDIQLVKYLNGNFYVKDFNFLFKLN